MTATKAKLVVSVDDTDNPDAGGTGRVARAVAARLRSRYRIWGVTRHQLAVLPEINYTKKNSANVVHLLDLPEDIEQITREAIECLGEMRLEGSEPGICVAPTSALAEAPLGNEAKGRFVSREEARDAAAQFGVILRAPFQGDGGIVGAFAGACLASQGNDGRFPRVGTLNEISGHITVADVLAAGGDEVRTDEDMPLTEGTIRVDRLRPALRDGKCVLYCRREAGVWVPIQGAPGDKEKEGELHAGS